MKNLRIVVVPVSPFQQNCSVIFDDVTKLGAVVDPGGDLDRIMDAIRQTGASIEKILLTHGHIDHAGGAAELKEMLGGIPIEGPHIDDQWHMDRLANRGKDFGMNDLRNVTPDRYLNDGDEVEAAGCTFKIVHAPGHSPGSVVFFSAENNFALMGDVLFQNSIGRTDLPRGDHATLMDSIFKKVLPLGDDVQFLPGHGSPSQIGIERRNNPFLKMQ